MTFPLPTPETIFDQLKPKMQESYFIHLPCKHYTRHFLSLNFGLPANLRTDPELYALLRGLLRRKNTRYENRTPMNPKTFPATTQIVISKDDFYRYGWELSKSDTFRFNNILENRVKLFMRTFVSVHSNLILQKDAITLFMQTFGFTEDIWTYDAIKKDCQRHCPLPKTNLKNDFLNQITEKVLVQLAKKGTTTPLLLKTISPNENN